MDISKKTIAAIIFNLLFPGAGYLYMRVKTRKPLAIFLLFITLYEFVRTVIDFMNGNIHHLYQVNLSPLFPGLVFAPLGIMLAAVLIVDTYFLAQKPRSKHI